jgi:cellulose biosynthesis protein BcsQ
MKLVKEFITKLSNQLNNWLGSKILDYKIIVQVDATLELRLLVANEFEESELFSLTDFKGCENIILITQISAIEFGENEYNNNETKIYYNHRRRFSRLIKPNNNIFSEDEKENLPPIITFYSYKGGLGRTTALACFAAYMAMTKNKKVVIVDCDFEAPGFSNGNYFFVDNRKKVCGVVEYLLDKDFLAHQTQKPNLQEYAYTVDTSFTKGGSNGEGEIYIIPSGNTKDEETYLESLARIDFAYDLKGFIADIQTTFELTPENGLILFDSRTGFNDTFAALAEVSETIVGLFGVNQQNEAGIEFFVKHFLETTDKNIFFIKGLTNNAKKETKRLEEILKKFGGDEIIIRYINSEEDRNDVNESKKPLWISHILNYPMLQNLGILETKKEKRTEDGKDYEIENLIPIVDKEEFKDFLISIEKERDATNMWAFFPKIAKSVEKKKPEITKIGVENIEVSQLPPIVKVSNTLSIEQKIAQWQQDASVERMFQLKFEFLKTITSPLPQAENQAQENIVSSFYFRAVMRDIFKKDKFIVTGGKGSGKTYWYRILEEKNIITKSLLERICQLENKKRDKYIFVNVVDVNNLQKISSIYTHSDKFEKKHYAAFWLLYAHYSICTHTSIKSFFVSKYIQNGVNFDTWIKHFLQANLEFTPAYEEISKELYEINEKLKELKKEIIISFDGLDKIVETKNWRIAISPLLNFWERNGNLSNFLPKIFIRADLFNTEKIEINNFLGVKSYATLDLSWTKEELFAYFFTTVLNQEKNRDLFFHYLVCAEKNNYEAKANEIIVDISRQFESEIKQIAPIKDEMQRLATLFFGERADFWGNNSFKYPTSYDWFVDNLQDALGETSLRAFWELIVLATKGESSNMSTKVSKNNSEIYFKENYKSIFESWGKTAKPRISTVYPLIEPRFYTWKGHREEAAKQFIEDLKSEEGNAALKELIDFFTVDLKESERRYNYLHAEFDNLMQRFLQQEFAKGGGNIKKIASNEKDSKEVILWLVNNGIVKKAITDYGDNTKYIFPYFYRSLFSLNEK